MEGMFNSRFVSMLGMLAVSASSCFAAEDLLDIYHYSLDADPELRQAEIVREISQETKRQDLARLLPSVNFSGNTTDNSQKRRYDVSLFDGEEDYNSHGYSLTLKQPLLRYENNVNLKQADDRINQAEAELLSARQSLIIRVSEGYFNVLAAQDNLRFIEAEKKAVTRRLEQAEKRLNAGLVAITDVYEAKAHLDTTMAQEIEAQNQLANSLESLREVTDRYHDELRPLSESFVLQKPEPSESEKWVELALKNNLQIIALRHNNRMLQREIGRQRAEHYPTLDLVASYSKSISGGGNFGRSDTENRAVGIQLNVPVYLGGASQSRVRQAVYQYHKNMEKMEATVRSVQSQARKAYLGVIASIARVQSLKQSVVSNSKALKAIETGYEAGMRTTSDVLQATRELFRAQRDYERARYDYVLNDLKLKRSAGNLSLSDLQQANLWLERRS